MPSWCVNVHVCLQSALWNLSCRPILIRIISLVNVKAYSHFLYILVYWLCRQKNTFYFFPFYSMSFHFFLSLCVSMYDQDNETLKWWMVDGSDCVLLSFMHRSKTNFVSSFLSISIGASKSSFHELVNCYTKHYLVIIIITSQVLLFFFKEVGENVVLVKISLKEEESIK